MPSADGSLKVKKRNKEPHKVLATGDAAWRASSGQVWRSSTFRWGCFSAIAVWLAFPPIGLWPLGWIATIGWIRLIRVTHLDGPRPYLTIYAVGYVHWLLMTQWVRLPHWAAGIGWFFLAAYLAAYVPLFVAVTRVLVHRCRISPLLGAPVVWVALEMVRAYAFTGWALALLSHSQAQFVAVIQLASVTGAYGVSFLLVLSAATVEQVMTWRGSPRAKHQWMPVSVSAAFVISVVCAGWTIVERQPLNDSSPSARVALIQGSLDTEFDGDVSRIERSFVDYLRMSQAAVAEYPDIDLVIWPESMFSGPYGRNALAKVDSDTPPAYLPREYPLQEEIRIGRLNAMNTVRSIRRPCLAGTNSRHYGDQEIRRYNTAAVFAADGTLQAAYHKMHPVMFGEYIPFGRTFPILYRMLPFYGGGLAPGEEPLTFESGGLWFSPSICFENTVPQLIRRQLTTLLAQGRQVDVLVTLTNDGWFWGSSLLDLHLACGVFRAVEHGKPVLICANTGISAHIDPHGRILRQAQRQRSQMLVTDVPRAQRQSTPYTRFGDWLPAACLIFSLGGLVWSGFRRPPWARQQDT